MPIRRDAFMAADRWACRLALLLEAVTLAWTGGHAAASRGAVDVNRALAVVALTAASLVLALVIHGRGVLGLAAPERES